MYRIVLSLEARTKRGALTAYYIWYVWKSSLDIEGANKMQSLIHPSPARGVSALGTEKIFLLKDNSEEEQLRLDLTFCERDWFSLQRSTGPQVCADLFREYNFILLSMQVGIVPSDGDCIFSTKYGN